jgi:hypothetical protein
MKKKAKKLTLNRETIRGLQGYQVIGGTGLGPTGYDQIEATGCQCAMNSQEYSYCVGISCGC